MRCSGHSHKTHEEGWKINMHPMRSSIKENGKRAYFCIYIYIYISVKTIGPFTAVDLEIG